MVSGETSSHEDSAAKVLFISPGIGYDNEIDDALQSAGFDVDTAYRAVHMPLPKNRDNIGKFLEFVSWKGEEAPDWGDQKPDVIASCDVVKKFEIGDNPMCEYDAEGLARLSGAAYVSLAPGVVQTMKSIVRGEVPLICEARTAVDRVQAAVSSLQK